MLRQSYENVAVIGREHFFLSEMLIEFTVRTRSLLRSLSRLREFACICAILQVFWFSCGKSGRIPKRKTAWSFCINPKPLKTYKKPIWPKTEMEDNGLEPMTFWLPVCRRLFVGLFVVYTCGENKKDVHWHVLFCLARVQKTRIRTQSHALLKTVFQTSHLFFWIFNV